MKTEYYIGKFVAWCLCKLGYHRAVHAPFMFPEDLICSRCWEYLGTEDELGKCRRYSDMGL